MEYRSVAGHTHMHTNPHNSHLGVILELAVHLLTYSCNSRRPENYKETHRNIKSKNKLCTDWNTRSGLNLTLE